MSIASAINASIAAFASRSAYTRVRARRPADLKPDGALLAGATRTRRNPVGTHDAGGDAIMLRRYQLRNRAGGRYRPSDQATRSSMLRAASSERFAAMRATPRSCG